MGLCDLFGLYRDKLGRKNMRGKVFMNKNIKRLISFILSPAVLSLSLPYAAAEEYPVEDLYKENGDVYSIEIDDETDGFEFGLNYTDHGTYYLNRDGTLLKDCLKSAEGHTFWFGNDGRAFTGRHIIEGKERTFNELGQYIRQHINTDYVDSTVMYDYESLTEDLYQLKRRYPEIFDYDSIGTTDDEREIWHITLGNPDADKQIVIAASCHAREHVTSLLVMDMTEQVLNKYYTDEYDGIPYSELFGDYAVHIIPMLNPDGVSISRFGEEGIKSPFIAAEVREIYKNAAASGETSLSPEQYYRRWKANGHGIDINRNFDAKWEIIDDLGGPSGWNYKGEEPVSEVESQSIVNFIDTLDNPMTIVSYHSTGSMLYWDYGQEDDLRIRSIAQRDLIVSLTGYTPLEYSETSAGGLSDYIAASDIGAVPQTIEVGVGEAPVDMSEYPSIWRKNKYVLPALAKLYMGEHADDIQEEET